MPELSVLITLAVIVVSAVVIFKIVKGVVHAVLITSAIVSIVVAIAGGFVVKDALDFKENFPAKSNLLLFSDNNGTRLVAGVMLKGGQPNMPIEALELRRLEQQVAEKNYAASLGENYKLIIANERALANNSVADGVAQEIGGIGSAEKTIALAVLFAQKVSEDPIFLLSQYKKGNIIVYPETAAFKAIRVMPLSFFKIVAQKAVEKAVQESKELAKEQAA